MKIKTKLQLSRISALATVCIFFASCLENEAEAENQAAEAAVPKPRVIELGDDVDEEQMRITKLIRERILKQVEKDRCGRGRLAGLTRKSWIPELLLKCFPSRAVAFAGRASRPMM